MRNVSANTVRLLFFICFLLLSGSAVAQIQFADDFSDGNFTANPTWQGDAARFVINSQQELQTAGPNSTDTAYLSTAGSMVAGNITEWRFYVKMSFAPSNNNYLKVFLAADQSNLEGPMQGYFLRMGENGSNDNIKLYKQDGSTETLLIDGSSTGLVSSSFNLFIKVTRSATGQWEILQTDDLANSYLSEGTVTDNSFTTSSFFGVYCRHTTSNTTSFYFDDFYMGTPQVDTTGPEAAAVSVTNATTLNLTFNEPVAAASSQTPANYIINNGIGSPVSVAFAANSSEVNLTINALTPGLNYEIIIDDIADTLGNLMNEADTLYFAYNPPYFANYRDVVINELMADPSPQVGLPPLEFAELYNPTANIVNLAGFTFSDGGTPVSLPFYNLQPGGYLILCAAADTAAFSAFGPVLPVALPALNNSGDNLQLRDSFGNLVDAVPYTLAWYNDPIKDDGGWTLEQINPLLPCSGASNWTASNDVSGGTPGIQNSVFNNLPDNVPPVLTSVLLGGINNDTLVLTFNEPMQAASLINVSSYSFTGGSLTVSAVGISDNLTQATLTLGVAATSGVLYTITADSARDCSGNMAAADSGTFGIGQTPAFGDIVINEILADENPQIGLPASEFIEIYNTTNQLINLQNVLLSDNSSATTLPAYLMTPNSYLILCSTSAVASFAPFGEVLGVSGFPSLTNAGEVLTLTAPGGVFINGVIYGDTWHSDPVKKDGGWSLERINPDLPCLNSQTNWASSNNPTGGTPGTQNSVFSNQPDTDIPAIVSLSLDTANKQITIAFNESADNVSLLNGSYVFQNSSLSVSQIEPVPPFYTEVKITYTGTVQQGIFYSLTVSNVSDCSGNTMSATIRSFGLGLLPTFGDLIINEILADENPQIGLPTAEFIEIYNTSTDLIELGGTVLTDNATAIILPAALLAPDSYLILTTVSAAPDFALYGPTLAVTGFPSLTNSGETLTLTSANGTFINGLMYSDDWHSDDVKRDGGWTLERVNPLLACVNNADNWRSSTNSLGGTPGSQNSIFNTLPDTKAPVITSLTLDTATQQITINFSESLDSSSLANGSYVLQGGNLTITQVQPQSPFFDEVRLSYAGAVQARRFICFNDQQHQRLLYQWFGGYYPKLWVGRSARLSRHYYHRNICRRKSAAFIARRRVYRNL